MNNEKKNYRVLAINPGSTSTKIGVFDGEECVFSSTIRHQKSELENKNEKGLFWQKGMRKALVLQELEKHRIPLESLDATAGRCGRLPPMASGTYQIDDTLMSLIPDPLPQPGTLGMVIAKEIGDQFHIPSFIVDPACTDEYEDVARVTGLPEVKRPSSFHALNQKAVARRAAKELGKAYEDCRFVVAHIGGGISVGAHFLGRVVDSSHGNNGDGPFTPERAGMIPPVMLLQLCFSGDYTKEELEEKFVRTGGVYAHFGTNDMQQVEKMAQEGNEKAALIYDAMAYNISKAIGSMYAVLKSNADAIILTGGLAYSDVFCKKIIDRVSGMARVIVYPGEDELRSLALGALSVMRHESKPVVYSPRTV